MDSDGTARGGSLVFVKADTAEEFREEVLKTLLSAAFNQRQKALHEQRPQLKAGHEALVGYIGGMVDHFKRLNILPIRADQADFPRGSVWEYKDTYYEIVQFQGEKLIQHEDDWESTIEYKLRDPCTTNQESLRFYRAMGDFKNKMRRVV
jgi:hypothetical protein